MTCQQTYEITYTKNSARHSRLEVVVELTNYPAKKIPPSLLRRATPNEYFDSRLWRTKTFTGTLIKAALKGYYKYIEFPFVKAYSSIFSSDIFD